MEHSLKCTIELLEEEVSALRELIEVARMVVSTLELDQVLLEILTSAMRFADASAGNIVLYDTVQGGLTLHAHQGFTPEFVLAERWEIRPGGVTERVISGGEILFVNDTEDNPLLVDPIVIREGIRSQACIPLKVQSRLAGILYLCDFVPREFDRERMKLLDVLASFAAMAIDNAQLHERTRLMAITDALTGLYNRRYFQQMFSRELNRAKRYGNPLSLIMMDVDDFKKFNDTYGHPLGDKLLGSMGDILTEALRNTDFAFRYGGEEFIVLLPETDFSSALNVAERLRESVEQKSVDEMRGIALNAVTVSVGVVSYPQDGETSDDLLNGVDELLYRAKEFGKNRVYYRTMGEKP
ncbi:sensor domain-containing diguanylate cyclase [Geobacter grbiciae]|uniref:sensor domain-containing diguanylate cyclase n=1 Tax=Geobacter grbiciae TaxID=155042 RepID=UPI001C01C1EB|nr:sensor domain-containing diguanylate cyclase [Geobacter grbiciae]MBT1075519.1 sensor domain-containing diguanylate cyclase [Geobacter grbiciae]